MPHRDAGVLHVTTYPLSCTIIYRFFYQTTKWLHRCNRILMISVKHSKSAKKRHLNYMNNIQCTQLPIFAVKTLNYQLLIFAVSTNEFNLFKTNLKL